MAEATCPPGIHERSSIRCFELLTGKCSSPTTRSMLFWPRPTTSKRRPAAGGTTQGIGGTAGMLARGRAAVALTFAFPLHKMAPMLPLTKRQREILDFLNDFIQQHGYAPSLEEIGRRFNLSSLATVHKHLTNLQDKGFIKRAWNRSRSVELVSSRLGGRAVELPLLGYVAAGAPIEAIVGSETIAVPEDLVGKRDTYVLRVKGDSMIDEQ